MNNKLFKEPWKIDNIILKTMNHQDIPNLEAILKILFELTNWEDILLEKYFPNYFNILLDTPHLPLGGKRENFHSYSILSKDENNYLGWLELYDKYPNIDTLWINALYLHPHIHNKGYGNKIVKEIINRFNMYGSIQLSILLRNWQALRFWHKNGFNKIIRFIGDEQYGSDKQSAMVLERKLSN